MRSWVAAFAAFVVLVALAGCGSAGAAKTVTEKTVIQQAPSSDSTSSNDSSPSDSSGGQSSRDSSSGDGGSVQVPDLVGERLDVAEEKLKQVGLKYKEIGGGTFGIVVKSNWEVCETDPGSGDAVGQGDRVNLIVDRPDSC